MKKLLLILTALILMPVQVYAIENGAVLNLKTGNSYILPLQKRPLKLQNSNPRAVCAEAVTNIEEADTSLLITTFEEGISYITFKQKNSEITLKLLIDNQAEEDKNIIKIDRPDKLEKIEKAEETKEQ